MRWIHRLGASSLMIVLACRPDTPTAEPAATGACEAFAWLVGTWGAREGGIATEEQWQLTAGGLQGHNRVFRAGAVMFEETLYIDLLGKHPIYRAAPSGQAPHVFPLQSCVDQHAVFADPTHDFPQRLAYQRSGNTLTVVAQGEEDGTPREASWVWTLATARPSREGAPQ